MHSAKGQEWNSVHVLNAVDGCMPADLATGHAGEIEEERRLLYVAMTRAKHQLTLLVPQKFHVTQQAAWRPPPVRTADALHPGELAQRHFRARGAGRGAGTEAAAPWHCRASI